MHGEKGNIRRIKVMQTWPDHIKKQIEYFHEGVAINERLRDQYEPASAFSERDLLQVVGTAELKEQHSASILVGTISNRCNRPITSLAFRVTAKNDAGIALWERTIRTMLAVKPGASSPVRLTLGDIHDAAAILWMIKEVRG